MNRDQKAAVVEEIAGQIRDAEAVFAVDYRGLSVSQAADLRAKLREADATFRVVKNSLTERAADKAGADGLRELLAGRRGVIFNVALLTLFAVFLSIQLFVIYGGAEVPAWVSTFAADAWQGYDHNPPAHMLALFTYMLSFHRLTSWVWLPLSNLLGWFLIPLGQSALYVYTVHTVLVFYVLQSLDRFQGLQGLPLTIALLALMLVLWVLVKRRFLFWLIPR